MPGFDRTSYGPAIAELLRDDPVMPLDATEPNAALRAMLTGQDVDRLFEPATVRDRAMAEACVAGLWLLADDLDRSHRISQGLHGPDGSYWHGIMHRREGDFANAKYWMRRVGVHLIHDALSQSARELAANDDPLRSLAAWDPYAFVDRCEAATNGRGGADLCRRSQQREWQLLFDHCYRRAVGDG